MSVFAGVARALAVLILIGGSVGGLAVLVGPNGVTAAIAPASMVLGIGLVKLGRRQDCRPIVRGLEWLLPLSGRWAAHAVAAVGAVLFAWPLLVVAYVIVSFMLFFA